MKKLILQPEQIIVHAEYTGGNKAEFDVYFRAYNAGCGEILPPAIVMHKDTRNMFFDVSKIDIPDVMHDIVLTSYQNYNGVMEDVFKSGAEYLLLFGHQPCLAATLAHAPISALELQTDEDIQKGKQMAENGELFHWSINYETLDKCIEDRKNWLLRHMRGKILDMDIIGTEITARPPHLSMTIKQRVDKLVRNRLFPEYMIKKYKAD